MSETSVFGTKAAVVVYDPQTKAWVPAKGTSKTLSRIDLYRHSAHGSYRIVGYTLDQELVINSVVNINTKYTKLSDTFHSFGDANNVMCWFNFALRAEAPLFFKAVTAAQQELLPVLDVPDALGMNKNDKRLGTLRLARRSPPPEHLTDETKRLSKQLGPRDPNLENGDQTSTSAEVLAAAEARSKRVAEKARQDAEHKAKIEAAAAKAAEDAKLKKKEEEAQRERKAQEEAERKQKEEAERKQREEAERKQREEAERKQREEAERKQKEEAERKQREEAERKQREEAEAAALKSQREEEAKRQAAAMEALKAASALTVARVPSGVDSAVDTGVSQLTGDLLILKNEILAEVRAMLSEFSLQPRTQ